MTCIHRYLSILLHHTAYKSNSLGLNYHSPVSLSTVWCHRLSLTNLILMWFVLYQSKNTCKTIMMVWYLMWFALIKGMRQIQVSYRGKSKTIPISQSQLETNILNCIDGWPVALQQTYAKYQSQMPSQRQNTHSSPSGKLNSITWIRMTRQYKQQLNIITHSKTSHIKMKLMTFQSLTWTKIKSTSLLIKCNSFVTIKMPYPLMTT